MTLTGVPLCELSKWTCLRTTLQSRNGSFLAQNLPGAPSQSLFSAAPRRSRSRLLLQWRNLAWFCLNINEVIRFAFLKMTIICPVLGSLSGK